jgi:Nuclease-related domain
MRGPFALAFVWAAGWAYVIWRWVPHGHFYSGLLGGACVGMISWVRDEPPEFIAKWKRGADGERQTARALRGLSEGGWCAVHDKTTGRGNIDHVAVGPSGVFLLESKNLSGTIQIDARGLTTVFGDAAIDSYTNGHLADWMRGSAARLKERIEDATHLRTWVSAVVVIWGEFPQGRYEHDRVTYVAGDSLREWLESLPVRLDAREVSLISLGLKADVVVPPAPPLDAVAT